MVAFGLLAEVAPGHGATLPVALEHPVPSGLSAEERYLKSSAEAIRLTSGMGLRGFRLNMAVEAAADTNALLAPLPRLQEAVGEENCRELHRLLRS